MELPDTVFEDLSFTDKINQEVHDLVEEGANFLDFERDEARARFVEALIKVGQGAEIDEYNYWWAYYGLLRSCHEIGQWKFGPGTKADYMKVARKMLADLDRRGQVGCEPFTRDGAFRMTAYREAANGLAWCLYEEETADQKTLSEALSLAEKAEEHVREQEHYFILDTKARILLKLGRQDEAFEIVKSVLQEKPDFGDFMDLGKDPEYLSWLKKASAP